MDFHFPQEVLVMFAIAQEALVCVIGAEVHKPKENARDFHHAR
jgi:hypothetical protein